nr:hypothetical protein [Tanacetum cinerariifolium]
MMATFAFKRKKKKKNVSIRYESSDEELEEQEERLVKKPKGVVISTSLIEEINRTVSEAETKMTGLGLEVFDEPSDKSTDSDKGAGTSPNVPDESKDKNKKIEDIPWKSENDDEEDESDDDKSIDIKKTNDERTNTGVKYHVKGVVEMNIVVEEEEDNTKRQKPFHAVKVSVIPESTLIPPTTPPVPPLPAREILSTQVPNFEAVKSFIQRFTELERDVKELKQADHSTTILTLIRSQVPSVVKEYLGSSLPYSFQKVLRSHTEELKKELSKKRDYKDVVEEFVQANVFNKVKNFLPKFLPHAINEALEKTPPSLGQSSSQGQYVIQAAESLFEYKLKKILYEKMHKSQSHLTHDTHQETYDVLTWSTLLNEATTKEDDKPDTVLKKRDRGDDQDEDPLTRLNQGKKTKKRRFNESESSKKTSTTKESSKVIEIALNNVNQTFDDKVGDSGQPPHIDANETQADVTPMILKRDWFKEASRPKTLDPDWNIVKNVDDAPEQSWFNEMIQAEKPLLTFDELMSTPVDFLAFAMNRLKLNKITRADLVGLMFNLLKGTYKICVELEYNMEECYHALIDQLDKLNPEGNKERTYFSSITKTLPARYTMEGIEVLISTLWSPIIIAYDKDAAIGISHWGTQRQQFYRAMINKVSKHKVFSTMRILSVVNVLVEKRSRYGYLKEIVVRRANQKLYKFKEGDFSDLHLNKIEDMLLLIAQNKLFNLEGDVFLGFVTALKIFTRGIIVKNKHILVKEPYTLNYDPPGIIYEDKSKKKRLMRVDEIQKFCDRTCQSIHKILCERLLNFKFGYKKDMPLRQWTSKDNEETIEVGGGGRNFSSNKTIRREKKRLEVRRTVRDEDTIRIETRRMRDMRTKICMRGNLLCYLKGGSENSGRKRLAISMVVEAWLSEKEEKRKNVLSKRKNVSSKIKNVFAEEKRMFSSKEKKESILPYVVKRLE